MPSEGGNFMENQYTKGLIEDIANNQFDRMEESLYYYRQGFNMGKEETQVEIVNALKEIGIDKKIISKVTNLSLKTIQQIID